MAEVGLTLMREAHFRAILPKMVKHARFVHELARFVQEVWRDNVRDVVVGGRGYR